MESLFEVLNLLLMGVAGLYEGSNRFGRNINQRLPAIDQYATAIVKSLSIFDLAAVGKNDPLASDSVLERYSDVRLRCVGVAVLTQQECSGYLF